MTSLQDSNRLAGTTASGSILKQAAEPIVIFAMLAQVGTSTGEPPQTALMRQARVLEQTRSGTTVSPDNQADLVSELRLLTGFTWDQIAQLFGVSRRAVHFWASGKVMTRSNEEQLHRVVATVRAVDRGSASANRAALLGVSEGGEMAFDLLASGEHERVLSMLGRGLGKRVRPGNISEAAKEQRKPRPPAETAEALQDPIHASSGRLLSSTPIRTTRRT